jgi:predicted porin
MAVLSLKNHVLAMVCVMAALAKRASALAALAATGAFAQSSVTIYGRANVDISSYSATGAAAGAAADLVSRTRVADSGSRFGFRVNEDLGGGLRAFVVCETGINIDNGGANGQGVGAAGPATASATTFCSREGHVGVGNNTVELRLGRQNVWWSHGELNQTGANFTSFDAIGGMYAPSSGMSAATISRESNVILLHAGSALGAFAGSQAYYSVNAQEGATTGTSTAVAATATAPATATGSPNKGSIMGFKLNYSQGPIVAMLDYAAGKNSANNSANSQDFDSNSTKVGVGYKYAAGSIASFTWFKHERTYNLAASNTAAPTIINLAAAFGSREQSGWAINLQHALTNQIGLYAQYGTFGDAKNSAGTAVADTGAKGIMLGARYNLSKRTAVYGAYAKLTNERANALNFSGGAYASGNSAVGADPKVMGVGIMHNF